MKSFLIALVLGVLSALLMASGAQAAAIFTLTESGGDVILSGSGTIDLTGLTREADFTSGGSHMNAAGAAFRTGPLTVTQLNIYSGVIGPSGFGITGGQFANSGTGDSFGKFSGNRIAVPGGYPSGIALTGTATWNGATLASLGVTSGTYVWSWASDSVTLNVQTVPIPAAVWLFGSALGLLGWMRRRHN